MSLITSTFRYLYKHVLCLALLVLLATPLFSQTVYVPVRHPVYDFLDRVEAKYGMQLIQFSRPLARIDIATALADVYTSGKRLTHYDRREMEFYFREFSEELARTRGRDSTISKYTDPRWHLLQVNAETPVRNYFAVDLVGRAAYELREDADNVLRRSNGVTAYGYVGDHLGALMSWIDNGLKGIPYGDGRATRVPEPAIVKGPGSNSDYEYEIAEGQFTYSTPWISAGIDKMDYWMGSGRMGSIILSDHAPSFPKVGFSLDITDWIQFRYFHGWLFSDSLDPALTYRPASGIGSVKFFETKYFASHSISARPTSNLELTLGESIVYGGSDVNLLFFIPVISFRAADRWTRATTGNSQFFADVRYSPINNLTLYGSGYIDEMDLTKVLSGDPVNKDYQIAYTVGLLTTDLYYGIVPLATETRLEFSRVYPFTYTNPSPIQQYTSHKAKLGHWIGTNADVFSLQHVMHPHRALSVSVSGRYARFGDQLRVQIPTPRTQPAFLYDHEYSHGSAKLSIQWQPLHDLRVWGFGEYNDLSKETAFRGTLSPQGMVIGGGIAYGVF
jgi:capsule assembly protein Wzi